MISMNALRSILRLACLIITSYYTNQVFRCYSYLYTTRMPYLRLLLLFIICKPNANGFQRFHVNRIKPYHYTEICDRLFQRRTVSIASSSLDNRNERQGSELQTKDNDFLSTSITKFNEVDWQSVRQTIVEETLEVIDCAKLAIQPIISNVAVDVQDLIKVCDELDDIYSEEAAITTENNDNFRLTEAVQLRRNALEFRRYEVLVKLMKQDYDAYITTASFLSPNRIPRNKLPNVQDVPMSKDEVQQQMLSSEEGLPLVPDCNLQNIGYDESPLDKLLLSIFRKLVTKNTGGVSSEKDGINGLLEQGRNFMLQPNQTPESQHKMVQTTLGELMTPVLPPFYRIFMSGILPKVEAFGEYGGKQVLGGPLPYASFLTSFVTPTFFGFLVGPSYPNLRKDGELGGLVVEKCKFLQESGCKGLCLHQCKIPAQQFFRDELGLVLSVSPNFVTQECQWSFGETPLLHEQDPSFPKGCLAGCESRRLISQQAEGVTIATTCS